MVLISGEKVRVQIITWRRDNGFHFSPKGKNDVQNAICAPGVNLSSEIYYTDLDQSLIDNQNFVFFCARKSENHHRLGVKSVWLVDSCSYKTEIHLE